MLYAIVSVVSGRDSYAEDLKTILEGPDDADLKALKAEFWKSGAVEFAAWLVQHHGFTEPEWTQLEI